jgi:heme oxygenase
MTEAEIEMTDMSDESVTANVDEVIGEGASAATELSDAIESQRTADIKDDLEKLDAAIESGDVSKINNPSIRAAAQKVIDTAKQTLAKLTEVYQKFNPTANFTELKFEDNLDPAKVTKEVADANNDVLSRQEAGIRAKITDPNAASEKFEKAAETESDATKRARYEMITRFLGVLAVGGVLGTLIYAFSKIADDMTGCYEVEVGKGQAILSCNSKTDLRQNCTCDVTLTPETAAKLLTNATSATPPGNGCIVDSTHECPAFQYVYKTVHWWDVAAIIANDLNNDYNDVFGGDGIIPKTLNWLESHWWVILLIVCVPILLTLILKMTSKSNS